MIDRFFGRQSSLRMTGKLVLLLSLAVWFVWHSPVSAPLTFSNDLIPKPSRQTVLVAVGDILLSRHVGAKIDEAGNPVLPFENLKDTLSAADLTFGNLECPLSPSEVPIREGLVFRCLTKYVPGLVVAGFDVLSTANNHAFDQGVKGLDFTIDYLKSQNILPVGTKKSVLPASPPDQGEEALPVISPPPKEGGEEEGVVGVVIERNGVKFGFLAYSYTALNDGSKSVHGQIATTDDLTQLQIDIASLKTLADVVVVSMHAGTEYTRAPNQNQIDFAHAAIDAGADIIIGHHPHWTQPVEIYSPQPSSPGDGEEVEERSESTRKGIIFYSLGNFVFDQMWSQETREGLVVKLNFENEELKTAELLPVIIDNYCCPRLTNEEEKLHILKKINLQSPLILFNNTEEDSYIRDNL